jgi:hypothetical protein
VLSSNVQINVKCTCRSYESVFSTPTPLALCASLVDCSPPKIKKKKKKRASRQASASECAGLAQMPSCAAALESLHQPIDHTCTTPPPIHPHRLTTTSQSQQDRQSTQRLIKPKLKTDFNQVTSSTGATRFRSGVLHCASQPPSSCTPFRIAESQGRSAIVFTTLYASSSLAERDEW